MKLRIIPYTVRQTFWNFRESPFTTLVTIATIMISLFIFNGFLLVEKNVTILLSGLADRVQMVVYLKEDLTNDEAQTVLEKLKNQHLVKQSRYISQEEAWRSFRDSLGDKKKILEGLSEKLLPASIEVTLRDGGRAPEQVRRLTQEWRALPEVVDVQVGEEWIERLGFLIRAIDVLKIVLGGLLFLATILIVSNTIKLSIFARKEEIGIMKLVGATDAFIKAPFVVEGLIHGAIGSVLAITTLGVTYLLVRERIPSTLSFLINPEQFQFLDPPVMSLIIGWGVLLGGCGSLFSCGRFLGD